MALTEPFNELAGKIVSNKELKELLRQAGVTDAQMFIDPSSMPPEQRKKMEKKVEAAMDAGHEAEVIELCSLPLYIASKSLNEVMKAALGEKDLQSAQNTMVSAMASHADNLYIEIQGLVKLAAWVSDDKKLTDAFIKAARECQDHRDDAGLYNLNQTVPRMDQEIKMKFR